MGRHPVQDLLVVLPGIMGSTLAQHGSLVWAPSVGGVVRAIRTFGDSIRSLTLPEGIGDDHPGDGVEPVALMPDVHVIPGIWSWNIGYGVLLDWLRTRFDVRERVAQDPARLANLLAVPYDWRLSNRFNGRRLKAIVEPALERWRLQGGAAADAKLVFICHSMGGLVARWYIEREGGAALTRKLITLGTPFRGALTALDQLVNGESTRIGPLKLDLTLFGRSLPSLHQLLPEYACVESPRGLLKTTETAIPELKAAMVSDGMRFHDELDLAAAGGYDLHPIVGIRQPTATTARVSGGTVEPIETIVSRDEGGDATVPRLSACPRTERGDSPIIRSIADHHGALPCNPSALDELEGILTATSTVYRSPDGIAIAVRTDAVILAGENLVIEATVPSGDRVALQARVFDEWGQEERVPLLRPAAASQRAVVADLAPGLYRVVVSPVGSAAVRAVPVTSAVLVWNAEP